MNFILATDPFCPYTYLFLPKVFELLAIYKAEEHFELLLAGAYLGDKSATLNTQSDLLSDLSKLSSKIQLHPALSNSTTQLSFEINSSKPSLALAVVKHIAPMQQLNYLASLQESFFEKGIDLNKWDVYKLLAKDYNFGENEFVEQMENPLLIQSCEAEFDAVKKLKTNTLPSLYFQYKNELYKIANGLVSLPQLCDTIEKILMKND